MAGQKVTSNSASAQIRPIRKRYSCPIVYHLQAYSRSSSLAFQFLEMNPPTEESANEGILVVGDDAPFNLRSYQAEMVEESMTNVRFQPSPNCFTNKKEHNCGNGYREWQNTHVFIILIVKTKRLLILLQSYRTNKGRTRVMRAK